MLRNEKDMMFKVVKLPTEAKCEMKDCWQDTKRHGIPEKGPLHTQEKLRGGTETPGLPRDPLGSTGKFQY